MTKSYRDSLPSIFVQPQECSQTSYKPPLKVTADGPEGYPYYVETTDGRVFQGKLDASGMLPRIHTGHNPDDYTVYWGDDAIAKQNEA